jgi:spermidine synthase
MLKSFTDWAGEIGVSYRGMRIISRCKNRRHRIEVGVTRAFGRALIINDEVQNYSSCEFLYHEPLVHLPAAFIEEPKSALVVGGGSLNALRELLKYQTLKAVRLVDIDRQVIELSVQTDRSKAKLLQDRRVDVIEADGYAHLKKTRDRFDLIVNDGQDLMRFRPERTIFGLFADRLTNQGACGDVIYRHIFERRRLLRTLRSLSVFRRRALSLVVVPEYPGALHLLTIWGKNRHISQRLKEPRNREQLDWNRARRNPCKYFHPNALRYFFYLPPYLRNMLEEDVLKS